jgi:hypothetical protein
MRFALPAAIFVALALLIGCGDSSSDEKTTGGSDEPNVARQVKADWERSPGCKRPRGASRWGCSVGSYRCQAVVVGRGWSVSCSKPGKSIAFIVRRD